MDNFSTPEAYVVPTHGKNQPVVALSGGVDSAVSLALLLDAGERPTAVFMKNWEEDDASGQCAAEQDMADAQAVCDHLGVPLRAVNFATEYWDEVFEGFLAQCRAGRTPNPDVLCNQSVKFACLADYAGDLGATRLVTGHYARLGRDEAGRVTLLAGVDPGKDQTYFLHRLSQAQLARAEFPIGEMRKSDVRARAAELGLPVHAKRDSTGICFIGEQPYRQFLQRWLPSQAGPILDERGERAGTHEGLAFYTPGQRQGLAIGGRRGGSGEPWYVAGKDFTRNALLCVQGRDHPALYAAALGADDTHWVAGEPPAMGERGLRCHARIRHRQPLQSCTVTAVHPKGTTSGEPGSIEVRFDAPQWAIAPGQYVVLYDGDRCLGGACINGIITP